MSLKHFLAFGCTSLLVACSATNPVPDDTKPYIPFVSGLIEEKPLEQLPATLTLDYFKSMRLAGTGLTLDFVETENSAYTRHAISYWSNGLRISGIMNIPKGEGPFPLVILNHGHIDPSVYTRGRGLKREQDYLARQGFAILHTDYRGHAESDPSPDTRNIYDASLEYTMDSLNAINAVKNANMPQIDTEHIGMMGHSLGGGITLNAAVTHPEMIDALILYAPVHCDAWENFSRWRSMREQGDNTREAFGTRESNPENWDNLSSCPKLGNIDDPVLLFHGTNDSDVPKEWSDFVAERLDELGKDITYVEYEGEKHEFIPQWNDFMRRTATFLREALTEKPDTDLPLLSDERVTKKPFGIFITPEGSPVSPERFRGYHTGADFEVFDGEDEKSIELPALCDGTVIYANRVSGYGGVLIQTCDINGETVTVLYGHISVASVELEKGDRVEKGDTIGVLGKGFSGETDGERPHLHLSIHKGTDIELKGYVQSEEELNAWMDPMTLF